MNFKKLLSLGLVSVLAVGLLASCSSNDKKDADTNKTDSKKIVVGASATPQGEMLKDVAVEKLKEKGITLEVKEFTDYPVQNKALADKQIDANFFQHGPYLEDYNAKNGTDLVPIGEVFSAPLAGYSSKIKSIDELTDGAKVAIPNDASNCTRALKLLQKQGLIEVKDAESLTEKDITKNPKNLDIKAADASQLPRTLSDVDFAIINANYALQSGIDTKTNLFIEQADDIKTYVNIVAARPDNKDNEALKELINVLRSDDAKKYIEDKFKGAIVPAN